MRVTKIVTQQFEFDRVPQPAPRTRIDPIYKHTPKLRKDRLNALSETTDQAPMHSSIRRRDHQHVGLLGQLCRNLCPTITKIAQRHAAVGLQPQAEGGLSIIAIAWRQHRANDLPVDIGQRAQLETKKPARAAFAKICRLITQQAYTPVMNRLADWDGLGVEDIQSPFEAVCLARGFDQMADEVAQGVQASEPLFIGAEFGKGGEIVISNQGVSFLQSGGPEDGLHQSNSEDFGISELGLGVIRATPTGKHRAGSDKVGSENVSSGHFIYNVSQRGRPPGARIGFATSFYTPSEL